MSLPVRDDARLDAITLSPAPVHFKRFAVMNCHGYLAARYLPSIGREMPRVSVTGPALRCSLKENPPGGSLEAKSIRSGLKCSRQVDRTVASHPAGKAPQLLTRVIVHVERSSSIFEIRTQATSDHFRLFRSTRFFLQS